MTACHPEFPDTLNYLCPAVTQVRQSRKYRYVGVAKRNGNFSPDSRARDKQELSKYGVNAMKRDGRWTPVEGRKYRLSERVGQLSKLGRVKLVFSRRRAGCTSRRQSETARP